MGGEILERDAQTGSRGLIPGNIQGQAERGFRQPDPVEDVSAHCRAFGLDDL